jgi:hypothetical protein
MTRSFGLGKESRSGSFAELRMTRFDGGAKEDRSRFFAALRMTSIRE